MPKHSGLFYFKFKEKSCARWKHFVTMEPVHYESIFFEIVKASGLKGLPGTKAQAYLVSGDEGKKFYNIDTCGNFIYI